MVSKRGETPAKLPADALGVHIGNRIPVCPTPLDSGFRRNDVVLQGSQRGRRDVGISRIRLTRVISACSCCED